MGRDLRKSQQMACSAVLGAEQGAGIAGEAGYRLAVSPALRALAPLRSYAG